MKKFTKILFIIIGSLMAALLIATLVGYFISSDAEVKANFLFVSGQAALFLAVNFVPLILKLMKIEVADCVYVIFIVFCLAHFLLGEILGFFAIVKWWDSMLHTISGMLIAILAFSFVKLLNGSNSGNKGISLACALVSAFCITIAVGVLWEIVEFLMDSWFGLNMQRAYVSNASGARGEALAGSKALIDTMKDLILDVFGALVVCVTIGIVSKKKGLDVNNLGLIKRVEKTNKSSTDLKVDLSEEKEEDETE